MPEDYGEYEDFITVKPKPVQTITTEQYNEGMEYNRILSALSGKKMTVKEIHDIFLDQKTKKHTKTLKTIYRHLESLEKIGLVTVAGHRKYVGKRTPEKLYCRIADLYLHQPVEDKEKWLKSSEGKLFIDKVVELMSALYGCDTTNNDGLKETLSTYYLEMHDQSMNVNQRIVSSPEIQKILKGLKIETVRNMLEYLTSLNVLVSDRDVQRRLLKDLCAIDI
jgi:DNA-binding transcriptional ArsR family regulator